MKKSRSVETSLYPSPSLIKCNCGNQTRASAALYNLISFHKKNILFLNYRNSLLYSPWLSIFRGISIRLVRTHRPRGREALRERERDRARKLFQSASFPLRPSSHPRSIRPRRRRECRVSCNYSPMNFRLFRDLFRFSYREEDRSRRSYLADIPLQCPREWDRIAAAVPRN